MTGKKVIMNHYQSNIGPKECFCEIMNDVLTIRLLNDVENYF